MLKILASTFLALVGAVPATAQGTVTVYTDSSYNGTSGSLALWALVPGQIYPLGGNFNDSITSLQWDLAQDVVIVFYENSNGTGREFTITHDQPRIGGDANVGSAYNDQFSSFRWATTNPSQGWFRLYTKANKQGYHLTRYVSLMGSNEVKLTSEGYNDDIESLEWSMPANKTAMCFEDDPVGGAALPLLGTGQYLDLESGLSGVYDDMFSVVRIFDGELTSSFADRNRPFDQIAQLSSHNAHVSSAQGWIYYNQNMPLLEQLDYGARCLQLDIGEHNSQLWLLHGTWTATLAARLGALPEPPGPAFQGIHGWLMAHPNEVIMLDIQNDAGTSATNWLNTCVLAPMFYKPDGLHWPSINELVAMGKRVVLANSSSGPGSQLDAYEWRVENEFSNLWTTTARGSSDDIDGMNRSMFLMNNISSTNTPITWLFGNSPNDLSPLLNHARSFGQRPNWVNIDGIEMAGDAGLEVCRILNTLDWQLPMPSEAYRFHDSCNGATELTVMTTPKIGTQFTVTGAPFQLTAIGFNDVAFNGISLPTSLPGLTTCQLRVSADLLQLSDQLGRTSLTLPNQSSLIGEQLFLQGAQVVSGNLPLSNGIAARIGF